MSLNSLKMNENTDMSHTSRTLNSTSESKILALKIWLQQRGQDYFFPACTKRVELKNQPQPTEITPLEKPWIISGNENGTSVWILTYNKNSSIKEQMSSPWWTLLLKMQKAVAQENILTILVQEDLWNPREPQGATPNAFLSELEQLNATKILSLTELPKPTSDIGKWVTFSLDSSVKKPSPKTEMSLMTSFHPRVFLDRPNLKKSAWIHLQNYASKCSSRGQT